MRAMCRKVSPGKTHPVFYTVQCGPSQRRPAVANGSAQLSLKRQGNAEQQVFEKGKGNEKEWRVKADLH
jgi:hypothetical protein